MKKELKWTLHNMMILKDDYHYRTDISTGQQKNSFQYLGLLSALSKVDGNFEAYRTFEAYLS